MEPEKNSCLFLDMMPETWSRNVTQMQRKTMTELVLRRNQPAVLRMGMGRAVLPFTADEKNLEAFFYRLCDWSLHACQETLKEGFLTLKDGSRVGVAGEAISDKGELKGVQKVQSLHLRRAREVEGCAAALLNLFSPARRQSGGLLLAGAPGTGKTTMLRDLCASLSAMGHSVAVVDTRRELQGSQLACCDLLLGYPKGKGMEIALRCLSPDFICTDELCSEEEALQVRASATGGAFPLTAVHGTSFAELLRRPALRSLLESGCFSCAALLQPGKQGVLQAAYERTEAGSWKRL